MPRSTCHPDHHLATVSFLLHHPACLPAAYAHAAVDYRVPAIKLGPDHLYVVLALSLT